MIAASDAVRRTRRSKVAGQVGIVYLSRLLKIIPSDLDRIFYQDGQGLAHGKQTLSGRRVPSVRPLNELCLSSPSDVMSRNSISAINDRSTHVAFGFLIGSSVWIPGSRLLMFTGMRIHSSEALKMGLIDRVTADSGLQDRTLELAETIANNAPLAVAAAKITIAEILKDVPERDMEAVSQIGVRCADSEDFREGRRAFMEKRKPVFRGC